MELIKWKQVDRKRRRGISYQDPEYIRGYDIDTQDFGSLVDRFNRGPLTGPEEKRLYDYALTIVAIVLENPKVSFKKGEFDGLTDQMFFDVWRSFKYIKPGSNPFNYTYRAGFTAVQTYFSRKIKERLKEAVIQEHIFDVMEEFYSETNAGKTDCAVYGDELEP